jgi:hypothetical protein
LLSHYEYVPFVQSNFYLQTDALTSVESAAPLPKDQRDMKVVQVHEISALSSSRHEAHVAHFSSVPVQAFILAIQKTCALRQSAAGRFLQIACEGQVCAPQ